MNLSIFILTYNEEKNLPRCLESLRGYTDDIIVVDSFSTDNSIAIAEEAGCRIYQNPFVNHAIQCNWALEHIDFKYEWILRLDSDEILPERLKAELIELLDNVGTEVTGIYLNRRMYFMNRWLKYGGMYPHYILRVFKKGCGQYEIKTEEHFVLKKGVSINAKNDFLEDNRLNTLKYWLHKHDDLSDGETRDTIHPLADSSTELKSRLFGTKIERTRWFKTRIYFRTPLFARAFLYFIYRYLFRLGFLDGIPGLIFHVLQGFWYRFYIDARIYESRINWVNTTNDYRDI